MGNLGLGDAIGQLQGSWPRELVFLEIMRKAFIDKG